MSVTVSDLVRREVHLCVSSLVWDLAKLYGTAETESGLVEQASGLFAPLEDWEEPARDAGWTLTDGADGEPVEVTREGDDGGPEYADSWREACELDSLDPFESEIFEHWAVSDWFGRKLAERGERVDFDFANLTVWGRACTGQAICLDPVVEAIHADMMRPVEGESA